MDSLLDMPREQGYDNQVIGKRKRAILVMQNGPIFLFIYTDVGVTL